MAVATISRSTRARPPHGQVLDGGQTSLDNDTDLDTTLPVWSAASTGVTRSDGTLTLNADGTFSYTHDGSENFTDTSPTGSPTTTARPAMPRHHHDHPGQRQHPGRRWPSLSRSRRRHRHHWPMLVPPPASWTTTPAWIAHRGDLVSNRCRPDGSLTLNADGTFSYTHDGIENFSDIHLPGHRQRRPHATMPPSRSRSPRSTTTRRSRMTESFHPSTRAARPPSRSGWGHQPCWTATRTWPALCDA